MIELLHNPRILLAVQVVIGLPVMVVLFYGFASLGALIADWLPLLIYLYFMAAAMRCLKKALWLESELGFLSRGWRKFRGSLVFILASYPLLYTLAFAMACRELQHVYGIGFSEVHSLWQWVAFGLDNLLEIVLADIPEIYGLELSRIEPASFVARTLVLAFRLSLDLLLLAWAAKCIRIALARRREREPIARGPEPSASG